MKRVGSFSHPSQVALRARPQLNQVPKSIRSTGDGVVRDDTHDKIVVVLLDIRARSWR
jgi:hypothetical protein